MTLADQVASPAAETPPRLVRLKYGLRLPVPPEWRPWVSGQVSQHRVSPMQYRTNARLVFVVVWVGFSGVFDVVTGVTTGNFYFLLPGFVGSAIGTALGLVIGRRIRSPLSDEEQERLLREHRLRWYGLRPDGSVDPEPDRLLTLAAFPSWFISVLVVLEVAAMAAILLLPVFVVWWLATH